MRIASFNVLHGRRAGVDGPVDVPLLAANAASLRAHVLAMQEVDVGVPRSGRVDLAAEVASACGMDVAFGKAARVGGIGAYGNALLVRGSIEGWRVVPLPRAARANEPRSAIVARVRVADGAVLAVVATHLSIPRPEVHDQLRAAVGLLAGEAGPRVLVGDLNLEPDDVLPVVEGAGLALAGGGPTFPVSDPRLRIDHVAVGGGLSVSSSTVVPTSSSDHAALVVEVTSP